MGGLLSRVTEIVNNTPWALEIRECPAGDPNGESVEPIHLRSGEHKDISATRFHENGVLARRARSVKVSVIQDGKAEYKAKVAPLFIPPHDFRTISKFVFEMDKQGKKLIFTPSNPERSEVSRLKVVRLIGLTAWRRPNR